MTGPTRRVALVTGASRGIGAAVARRLAGEGFDLTLSARSAGPLARIAGEILGAHDISVHTHTADLAHEDDVRALASAHLKAHDRVDLLVLNAGMGAIGSAADFPLRRLDKLVTVNLRSAYILGQELLPVLRASAAESAYGTRIVAIASTTGLVGEPLNSAYGATKAALVAWCETLSTEESLGGVSATAICPGYVATDMTEGLADTMAPEDMIPVADVAEAVAAVARLSRRTVVPTMPLLRPGAHLWRA